MILLVGLGEKYIRGLLNMSLVDDFIDVKKGVVKRTEYFEL